MFGLDIIIKKINSFKLRHQLLLSITLLISFNFMFLLGIISVNMLLLTNTLYLDFMNVLDNLDLDEINTFSSFLDLSLKSYAEDSKTYTKMLNSIYNSIEDYDKTMFFLNKKDTSSIINAKEYDNNLIKNDYIGYFTYSNTFNKTDFEYTVQNFIILKPCLEFMKTIHISYLEIKAINYLNELNIKTSNDNKLTPTSFLENAIFHIPNSNSIFYYPYSEIGNNLSEEKIKKDIVLTFSNSAATLSNKTYNNNIKNSIINEKKSIDHTISLNSSSVGNNNTLIIESNQSFNITLFSPISFLNYSSYFIFTELKNSFNIINNIEYYKLEALRKIASLNELRDFTYVNNYNLADLNNSNSFLVDELNYNNENSTYKPLRIKLDNDNYYKVVSRQLPNGNINETDFILRLLLLKPDLKNKIYKDDLYNKSLGRLVSSISIILLINYITIMIILHNLMSVIKMIDKPMLLINNVIHSISETEKFRISKTELENYIVSEEEILEEFIELMSIILSMIQDNNEAITKISRSQKIRNLTEAREIQRDFYLIKANNLMIFENKIKAKLISDSYFKQTQSIDINTILKDISLQNTPFFIEICKDYLSQVHKNKFKIENLKEQKEDFENRLKLKRFELNFDEKVEVTRKNSKIIKKKIQAIKKQNNFKRSSFFERDRLNTEESSNKHMHDEEYDSSESLTNDNEEQFYFPEIISNLLKDKSNPYFSLYDL